MEPVGREGILFYDTLLRYYLSINPEPLEDEVWAHSIAHLRKIRELEAQAPTHG